MVEDMNAPSLWEVPDCMMSIAHASKGLVYCPEGTDSEIQPTPQGSAYTSVALLCSVCGTWWLVLKPAVWLPARFNTSTPGKPSGGGKGVDTPKTAPRPLR